MFDRLLGRAPLRERIDELETENERLRRRYEAESDRRADAVTDRQRVEEQRNRLEDRLAQLEGELERARASDGEREASPPARVERLRGRRVDEVFDRLSSFETGPEGALTAGIGADGDVPDAVTETLGDGRLRRRLAEAAPCLVCLDDAGVLAVALSGPLVPTPEPTWSDRFALERSWVRPSGRYTLALVRADLFALGIYEGDERVAYRGFESEVKGSHSKGGFSQARFERRREEQIDAHLERCREALEERAAERLYLVGGTDLVDQLAADLAPDAVATVDATGAPKSALEDAFADFWSVRLTAL
ncbi:Vms1/Ankzf1 family peptidyl-tRNA hydrolase [Natronobiforma cellulositropha]|uniref:Vms1/Ankzf1 family peptidyl-tRNA hydrolase n=1 Tax=Natronobiforma cellulositropha TaxID=1679076 RepID=UPI0021D60D40|nr:Vms1/Ankzf1 family peptidyl-tRNA hydrolase [Natronobiforma cellulositropha]